VLRKKLDGLFCGGCIASYHFCKLRIFLLDLCLRFRPQAMLAHSLQIQNTPSPSDGALGEIRQRDKL
jgi:hypothetical protein